MSKGSRQEVPLASGEFALRTADALPHAGLGEDTLVERCRRGEPEAFARLVALHERMVFNLAARLLNDAEEARDLGQDVFLQVYKTIERFEGRSSLRTWIYRIVVNQCRNRRRWWRRRRREAWTPIENLTASDEADMAARQGGEDAVERVARRERAARVQRALEGLSFDHRAVLLLREVEGLSCEEIGQALGLPEGTVKSRLSRARDGLRVQMEKMAPELRAAR